MKNKIVHVEITAKDPKKAAEFYSTVFDWETSFMEEMDYFTFNDGAVGGGFSSPQEGLPFGTVIYLNTNDVEKALSKVKANGGTEIQGKTEISTVGWFGLFKDLEGNLIGLFENLPSE